MNRKGNCDLHAKALGRSWYDQLLCPGAIFSLENGISPTQLFNVKPPSPFEVTDSH